MATVMDLVEALSELIASPIAVEKDSQQLATASRRDGLSGHRNASLVAMLPSRLQSDFLELAVDAEPAAGTNHLRLVDWIDDCLD